MTSIKRAGYSIRPEDGVNPPNWVGGNNLPYGGWSHFVEHLLKTLGKDDDTMEGYGGTQPWNVQADPIGHVMAVNDFQWEFPPEVCRLVAPRIRALIQSGDEEAILTGEMLAELMEFCASRNTPLVMT